MVGEEMERLLGKGGDLTWMSDGSGFQMEGVSLVIRWDFFSRLLLSFLVTPLSCHHTGACLPTFKYARGTRFHHRTNIIVS